MSEMFGLSAGAVVCGQCHLVSGEVPGLFRQSCRCHPESGWEPIPGYDFPRAAELCRCCGARLVRSGSKYSTWFCDPCLPLVRRFNEDAESYVIPTGRHSFHGRLALSLSDGGGASAVADFTGVKQWFARMEWIENWNGEAVGYNRELLELGTSDMLLAGYLELVEESATPGLSSEEALRRMARAL